LKSKKKSNKTYLLGIENIFHTRIYGTSKVSSVLFILYYCTTELLLTPLSVFKTNQTHHRLIFVVDLEIVIVVVDLVDILKVVLHVQQHHEQN
jgi:hypothetical protein